MWVNHIAFKADEARQAEVRERMAAEGIDPLMDVDHGWCHSLYFLDPNGIMVELCRDTPGFEPDPDGAPRRAVRQATEKHGARRSRIRA